MTMMQTQMTTQVAELRIEPREAVTGFFDLPEVGRIRLDFLVTYESGAYYIRCLDFGVMSCGDTIEECKENVREAILIYLEDLPEGQSLYKPAAMGYWQMFYDLRAREEARKSQSLSQEARRVLAGLLQRPEQVALQYA
jgi:predicted RNase H-like HicB family nuclease